ncbi:MAG TPA: L,D-transpeptidase family protein [Gammaproteobacteria bacterium]|nr:L,D-transpeptidase family protein [Gammaproteobacteria bacterium]
MHAITTVLVCTLATGHSYPCSIGKNGVCAHKQEGDNTTPAGSFALRRVFYREDKLTAPELATLTQLKERGFSVQPLTPDDGWCDDPASPYYNQYIKLSTFDRTKVPPHENLWHKDDDLYDIIVALGYNDNPVRPSKGSAVFMHIARQTSEDNYEPTAGCVAFSKNDLLQVLAHATLASRLVVTEKGTITLK